MPGPIRLRSSASTLSTVARASATSGRRTTSLTWLTGFEVRKCSVAPSTPVSRPARRWSMCDSPIDHRLAGLLTGVEGATLHLRTSNPVNHVKLVVRLPDVAEARATVDKVDAELRKRIGPGIYGIDGETFPAAVAK